MIGTALIRKILRYTYLTLPLIFSLNSIINAKAEVPMGAGDYKTIEVHYKISGTHQFGGEVFYQIGKKTYRKTQLTTKINLREYQEHVLEIDDGSYFYRINLIDKTGLKLPSINHLKSEMIKNNPHLFAKGATTPLSVTPKKGKLKKTESILGKLCNTYLHNSRLVFIWQDIILKEQWDVLGPVVKEATNIKLNEYVSDHVFNIPPEIEFRDKSAF